jgi:hypothetical protein
VFAADPEKDADLVHQLKRTLRRLAKHRTRDDVVNDATVT